MLCGFFKVEDFVCFLTFFITAVVSLLFIQYSLVYFDADDDDSFKSLYLMLSCYFFILTIFACLVFAGVQMKSPTLLRWPGRFLSAMIVFGLTATTSFLWILDRVYHKFIVDLERKTFNLCIMIIVVVLYFIAICKFIWKIENSGQGQSNNNNSDQNLQQHQQLLLRQANNPPHPIHAYDTPSTSSIIAAPTNNSAGSKNFYVFMKESPKAVTNYYVYYGVGKVPEIV